MIVRAWRGRAAPAQPDDYPEHFRFRVLPALKEIKGFLGASLLRHDRPDEIEFLVLTRWTSLDAIRAFAGEHLDRAVVEPEGMAALVSFDPTVRHYEVIEEAAVRRRRLAALLDCFSLRIFVSLTPAKSPDQVRGGVQGQPVRPCNPWIPAFAGMTKERMSAPRSRQRT